MKQTNAFKMNHEFEADVAAAADKWSTLETIERNNHTYEYAMNTYHDIVYIGASMTDDKVSSTVHGYSQIL